MHAIVQGAELDQGGLGQLDTIDGDLGGLGRQVGELDGLGDTSTLADPGVVDTLIALRGK